VHTGELGFVPAGVCMTASSRSMLCVLCVSPQGIPESDGSGYYGAPGEFCEQCPKGAICTTKPVNEPLAVFGWWKLYERTWVQNATNGTSPNPRCTADQVAKRATCPVMVPCEPPESCLGNNTVSEGCCRVTVIDCDCTQGVW
jgi:hypothetical protein